MHFLDKVMGAATQRRDGYRHTGKELGSICYFWTQEERDARSLCRTDSTTGADTTAMPLSRTETRGVWLWGCSVMLWDVYLQQNPGEMRSELKNEGETGMCHQRSGDS